jgi:hypothetical protein
MEYTKTSDTTAEKTTITKRKITLEQANKEVELLTAELAEAQKVVNDLKGLGLKTQAQVLVEKEPLQEEIIKG